MSTRKSQTNMQTKAVILHCVFFPVWFFHAFFLILYMVGHPTWKVLPKLAPENDTPGVTGIQQLEMIGHPPVFKDTLENIYRICPFNGEQQKNGESLGGSLSFKYLRRRINRPIFCSLNRSVFSLLNIKFLCSPFKYFHKKRKEKELIITQRTLTIPYFNSLSPPHRTRELHGCSSVVQIHDAVYMCIIVKRIKCLGNCILQFFLKVSIY